MAELRSGPIYPILCRLRRETVIVAVMAVPDLPEQLFRWAGSVVRRSVQPHASETKIVPEESRRTRASYRDMMTYSTFRHGLSSSRRPAVLTWLCSVGTRKDS
jgi:hypothetical protein